MTTKELQDKIAHNMRRWQRVEDLAISSTDRVIEKTSNPILRLVMDIIRRDSQTHHEVQGLVADSLEGKPIALTPDDMGLVWELIEKHIEIERQTVELARTCLDALKGEKMVVQEYLINYLLKDEEKHEALLEDLGSIKRGMYP